jgi:hypothetical protein
MFLNPITACSIRIEFDLTSTFDIYGKNRFHIGIIYEGNDYIKWFVTSNFCLSFGQFKILTPTVPTVMC